MNATPEVRTILTSVAEQMAEQMSEQQLLTEIGLRARTFALYPAAANSVETSVPEAVALERAWDDLGGFGNWIFRRLHRQLQSVLPAGGHDAEGSRQPRGLNPTEFASAGAIVSALTATLGVAPAIASVVTALVLKRVSNPGWQETYVRPSRLMALAQ
jgi:hypothetical protein